VHALAITFFYGLALMLLLGHPVLAFFNTFFHPALPFHVQAKQQHNRSLTKLDLDCSTWFRDGSIGDIGASGAKALETVLHHKDRVKLNLGFIDLEEDKMFRYISSAILDDNPSSILY
jgi:hypothetical protein